MSSEKIYCLIQLPIFLSLFFEMSRYFFVSLELEIENTTFKKLSSFSLTISFTV